MVPEVSVSGQLSRPLTSEMSSLLEVPNPSDTHKLGDQDFHTQTFGECFNPNQFYLLTLTVGFSESGSIGEHLGLSGTNRETHLQIPKGSWGVSMLGSDRNLGMSTEAPSIGETGCGLPLGTKVPIGKASRLPS